MAENKEIKAGLGYTVGNILIKGISFLTLPIFSRLLSTEEFGIYNTYLAYENILAIFLGLGMYSSIKNANQDFPSQTKKYVSTLLWLTVIPLAISLILVALFHIGITGFTGLSTSLLLLLVFQSYGSAMLSVSNARLALNYEYKKYMGFAGFNTIVNVVLSIVLILTIYSEQREYGRIVGSAIPLILIGAYVFITEEKRGNFKFDKKFAKYAIAIGFPLIWHYLSQQIQGQFDRIAITNIVGASATGIYSFAYNIANILKVIFYSTENVWTIWFFKKMAEGKYKDIRNVSKKYTLLIAGIAICMLVFSKEVIMIMGDKEYWEGATIFIPLLISEYLVHLYTIPVGIEYYYKKTNYIAAMTVLAAIVNVSLNYALIPVFGYVAAAFTTMVSYAVQFISHWIISKKILKKNEIKNIFYFRDLAARFVLVCLVGIAVYILNPHPIIKYSLFIVGMSIACFIYRKDIKLLVQNVFSRNKD
ncbi:MAG: oligosaccharide flippase family protein [Oscillospiraceae bacterium]|nr:oligosaccharide flippase family protein [Oscillospiraceae bacterium]